MRKPGSFSPTGETRQQRRKKYDDRRGSSSKRGYGRDWQKAAKEYRKQFPLCAEHLRRGRIVSGYCVDHIIPHKGDEELFWNEENWQTLCQACHAAKSGRGE